MPGCVSCAEAFRVNSEIGESDTVGVVWKQLWRDCMAIVVERINMLLDCGKNNKLNCAVEQVEQIRKRSAIGAVTVTDS
jgi:hypothetical protein